MATRDGLRGISSLRGADTATPEFTPDVSGTYSFVLDVDDGFSGVSQDVANVTVNAIEVPTSTNWKPLVATFFILAPLVVGAWSARRRPWRNRRDSHSVGSAFARISLPFVLAEAATGVVSYFTGALRIPPMVDVGTAVDLAILFLGCAVAVYGAGERLLPAPGDGEARMR